MKKIMIFSLCLMLSGCGTVMSRSKSNVQTCERSIYMGVKADLKLFNQDTEDDAGKIIPLLDIPLSIIGDTILLPVDVILWWGKQ